MSNSRIVPQCVILCAGDEYSTNVDEDEPARKGRHTEAELLYAKVERPCRKAQDHAVRAHVDSTVHELDKLIHQSSRVSKHPTT